MKHPWIKQALTTRKAQGQIRQLRTMNPETFPLIEVDGRQLVNFSSNDYLGLAAHPGLIERALEFTKSYGSGSRASRLVCSNHPLYHPIETKLARLKGTEKALILNSGFQANIGLVPALAGPEDFILMDKLIHNSLIQGVKLSGAKFRRFRHNDIAHLSELLSQAKGRRVFVLAETVYSMDGDIPDLAAMVATCQQYNAFLVLDEAHATGVLGPQGMGLSVGLGADLVIGTFGKGLGSFGAYLAGSAELMEYLVNFHAGLIYSTSLPPSVLGSIDAALDLVPTLENQRTHLRCLAQQLRDQLQAQGYDTLGSQSQIIPVLVGPETECLELSRFLEEQGFLAIAIRPPTVEPQKARIRLALSALHSTDQINQLIHAFSEWRNR